MNKENQQSRSHALHFRKWSFYLLCLIVLARVFYYAATEGFCPERIYTPSASLHKQSEILVHAHLKTNFPAELMNTPFHYLKKGSQAYAFESGDGKYVLKLFKRHHMQEADWLKNLPTFGPLTDWKNFLLQKRKRRLDLTLKSYVIATNRLQKQCAILAYQLEPTNTSLIPVELIDGIGRKHSILLDKCGFVLQKKASLLFPSFSLWIQSHDHESAKKALHSLVDLIAYRSKLGIQDIDPDLHKNAGLVGTEAIFIDIGSFTQSDQPLAKEAFRYDIKKISKELHQWLVTQDEGLAVYLDQVIEEAIQRY